MKKILKTLAVMAVIVSVAAVPAMAQSELDQSQTTTDVPVVMDRSHASQTFTAQKTGTLDKVSVHVGCCEGGDWISDSSALFVKVEGIQSGSVGEGLVDTGGWRFGSEWREVPLGPAPFVEAGEQYRLTLWTDLRASMYYVGMATTDVYSGGEFHYSEDGGESWITTSDWDMAFKTYVTSPVIAHITDTDPDNADTGVARTIKPTVVFDTDLDPATVNAQNVKLQLYNAKKKRWVTVSSTPSYDDKVITVNPTNTLGSQKRYRVVLSTNIESSTDQNLEQPFSFRFTTRR